MKVSELIEKLQKLDPKATIFTLDYEKDEVVPIDKIDPVTVTKTPYGGEYKLRKHEQANPKFEVHECYVID